VIGIPIKGFRRAKTRLGDLESQMRERLVRSVAARVVTAALETNADTFVVTADADTADWSTGMGAGVIVEPEGRGLDGAAEAAAGLATAAGVPWCVAHADLPLLDTRHLAAALEVAAGGGCAIAPSRVGGTNLLASRSMVRFRYGPASFHHHLASLHDAPIRVIVSIETALDLDTVDDLVGAASLPGGAWLAEFTCHLR
jgi:2-phospho-L-lactate guanylyltransferase